VADQSEPAAGGTKPGGADQGRTKPGGGEAGSLDAEATPQERGSVPAAPTAPAAPTTDLGRVRGPARLAAVILLLFGIWFAILGGLTIEAALDPSGFMGRQIGDAFGAGTRGTVAFIGIAVLLVAILEVAGAIGAWRGRTWGRILGVVYAIVFALGSAVVLIVTHGPSPTSVALVVGVLIAYSFVGLVLAVRWPHSNPVEPTDGNG
jgi:uncharacterized membrane protein (DUF2068 family)